METQLFAQIAGTGLTGVFLVLMVLAYRSKEKELKAKDEELRAALKEKDEALEAKNLELKAEMQLRIEDAHRVNGVILGIQKEVINAVHHLGEIVDYIKHSQPPRRTKENEPT